MNRRHLWLTFRKDGLELLRDRRTLFVNVVLPVLLYPVLALIVLQVLAVTRPGPDDLPRLGLVDIPVAIERDLAVRDRIDPEHRDPAFIPIRDQDLGALARAFLAADPEAENSTPQRSSLLAAMRALDCSLLLVSTDPTDDPDAPLDFHLLVDNAHRDALASRHALRRAGEAIAARLRRHHLARRGLDADMAEPLRLHEQNLAPRSEAARTQLGGIIPVILLLMAISGAFYPALDLIAGERERGTLETLLSWPADRQAVFTGKLLVVMSAATVTVLLNLISLGITTAIIGTQLPAEANFFGDGIAIGPLTLLVGLVLLIPVTLTLAAISLSLAGMAASYKEAQNYLSPLMLAIMAPGMLCLLPQVRPHLLLDLIPILGPLVALKDSLQGGIIPWPHVILAATASIGLCAVIVQWAVRLLGEERFLYPTLSRHGWGRSAHLPGAQRWPNGIEAILLWCTVLGCFWIVGGLAADWGPLGRTTLPLLIGVLLPTLLYAWLGDYPIRRVLPVRAMNARGWILLAPLLACCVVLTSAIAMLQMGLVPLEEVQDAQEQILEIVRGLQESGGLPLLLIALALVPGICEEALFRGPVLAGLRRSLGDGSAVVISAACFAVTHLHPARFFPQFALGIVAGALVLRTRSLIPAIVLHAGYNGLLVLLMWRSGFEAAPTATGAKRGFAEVVEELHASWPALAQALRALGPLGSSLLGVTIAILAALLCARIIRALPGGGDADTPQDHQAKGTHT